jgi:hypothetical protein
MDPNNFSRPPSVEYSIPSRTEKVLALVFLEKRVKILWNDNSEEFPRKYSNLQL